MESGQAPVPSRSGEETPPGGTVLFLTSDLLGAGPEELGRILMRSFLKTCQALEPAPWRVILVNNGVRLSTEGSPLLDDLRGMEEAGAELLSCGTCLDYFQAKDQLRVGRVANMQEIVQTLNTAGRVLRP